MQTLAAASHHLAYGPQRVVVDLAGRLATATVHGETTDRSDAIAARPQGIEGLREAGTEGADQAGRRDRDASICYGWSVKYHSLFNRAEVIDSC